MYDVERAKGRTMRWRMRCECACCRAHLQMASTLVISLSAVLRSLALAAAMISARITSICACLCCVMSAINLFSSSDRAAWKGAFDTGGKSKLRLLSAAE